MKKIITIQHTQSVHHTNGMVGSWTDWDLSELGVKQAGGVSFMEERDDGKRFIKRISDMSYIK